jgi:aryl-alcohol dehydrogenase-like predicted oxidoreductase
MYRANENRYGDMLYRRCGQSGVQLPFLSLGLWHGFGDNKPYAAMREMALGVFDLGITHFDIANNYGPPPGSAEINFARILKKDLAEEKVDKAKRLDKLAQKRGQTLSQMVLAWSLRSPAMTSLVIGASSLPQIQENLEARNNLNFSEAELVEIDAILGTCRE